MKNVSKSTDLAFYKDAIQLWATMIGRYQDEYTDRIVASRELTFYGDVAADLILRDLEAAVEHGDVGDREASLDLPRLDVDCLGGKGNAREILDVLRSIGGDTANLAISLICMADDVDLSGRSEQLLGEAGGPEAIRVLVRRLARGEPVVTGAAARALHRVGANAVCVVCASLSATKEQDRNSDGIIFVRWLGDEGDPTALPTLVETLSGDHEDVPAEDAPTVRRTVESGRPSESVRAAAAAALGRIGDRRAMDALIAAIGTYDCRTSEAAIGAVQALGGDPRAVLPTLRAVLPARRTDLSGWWEWEGRVEKISAMGAVYEPLMDATEDSDPFARSLALRCLARVLGDGGRGDIRPWREQAAAARAAVLLKDLSASVRLSAVRLLHRLASPGRAALLVPILEDVGNDEFELEPISSFDPENTHSVASASVAALPDGSDTAEHLREALHDGRLRAARAWALFMEEPVPEWSRSPRQGTPRFADVIAPYLVKEAECGDEEAAVVLTEDVGMQTLEDLGLADQALGIMAQWETKWEEEARETREVAIRRSESASRNEKPTHAVTAPQLVSAPTWQDYQAKEQAERRERERVAQEQRDTEIATWRRQYRERRLTPHEEKEAEQRRVEEIARKREKEMQANLRHKRRRAMETWPSVVKLEDFLIKYGRETLDALREEVENASPITSRHS